MMAGHAQRVLAIYQAGIAEGDATFETRAPSWEEFDAARRPDHRFVALRADTVVGWVAVSPVSRREVYAGVVEHSVYVDPAARGLGIARLLMTTLITSTEAAGIWTIQSGIFPRTPPASPCTKRSASVPLAGGSASASIRAAGATSCSWNAAARPPADRPRDCRMEKVRKAF
jgi:L-amino acid N-acyltransferase YncA